MQGVCIHDINNEIRCIDAAMYVSMYEKYAYICLYKNVNTKVKNKVGIAGVLLELHRFFVLFQLKERFVQDFNIESVLTVGMCQVTDCIQRADFYIGDHSHDDKNSIKPTWVLGMTEMIYM